MEEILRELSAQNEQAQANGAVRRGLRDSATATRRDGAGPTIHVERDGAFRTPEGTPSARAYLPAKTLAPTPSAPIEIATVRVADPRRLPTVRVPRKHERGGLASPLPDEGVPTLRSGAPADGAPKEILPDARRSHMGWWVAGMAALALAAAVAVAIAVHGLP